MSPLDIIIPLWYNKNIPMWYIQGGEIMENTKVKKPIYKKWWFWLVVVIVIIAIVSGTSGGSGDNNTDNNTTTTSAVETEPKITYEKTDLQDMFDALDANALKAEKTYQDKYVEIEGKIKNFDSDGSYISVEPANADEWNFSSAMCYIKNDAQLDFLLEKSVGDKVTIQGQITSIGEVLGYSIDIDSVK